MCSNQDLFSSYETITGGFVMTGSNEPCGIFGIGKVKIKILNGTVRTLGQVRHVPGINKNMISLSTLDSK